MKKDNENLTEEQYARLKEQLTGGTEVKEEKTEIESAKPESVQTEEPQQGVNRIRLLIAIGCFAAGLILFVLSIALASAVKGVGVYLTISSLICELAAVTFINAQKRIKNDNLCFVFTLLSYAVMIAGIAVMTIGTGLSASNK